MPIPGRRVIISISMPLVVHAALSSVYIADIGVETLKVDFVIVKLLNVDVLTLCRALLLLATTIDLILVSLMLGRPLLRLERLSRLILVVRRVDGRGCCWFLAIVRLTSTGELGSAASTVLESFEFFVGVS